MSDQPETVETGRGGFSRRGLLGGALVAGALVGAAAGPAAAAPTRPRARTMLDVPFEPVRLVRIGVIGLGNRGMGMLSAWVDIPGARSWPCATSAPTAPRAAADLVEPPASPRPTEYGGIRGSFTADAATATSSTSSTSPPRGSSTTPRARRRCWPARTSAVELPIATELDELWDLVDTSEKTRKHLWLIGELQLRPQRARDAQDGPRGRLRRDHRRPRRLPARPARAAVRRRLLHRRLAPALAHPQHRELLPDARPGPDRGGDGHQPRRPGHHPARHRDRAARAGRLPRAVRAARPPRPGRRSTSTATSSPA